MKIRTITCHHVYNHGAMLQAYALVTYLRSLGHDAEIIDYRPPNLEEQFDLWGIAPRYKHLGIGLIYLLVKLPARIYALKRKKAFDKFFNKYMLISKCNYHSIDDLRNNPPNADLYIAGSDQIWNTQFKNGTDPSFYLDFGDCRKISYAASFATSMLRKGTEKFIKEMLNNFDAISVREESALKLLEELGFAGTIVLDPVFLLSKEEWDSLSDDTGDGEEYILTYDFEKRNTSIGDVANILSKKLNCKIYSVGPYKMRYSHKNYINVGPTTFISLIKNAKCVISNSFHGTAFSIIYKKNFFVANRKDLLNVRMHDLLNRYDISERLISDNLTVDKLITPIDYQKIEDKLNTDINCSKSYLSKQIYLAQRIK